MLNYFVKKINNKKGFTLVELVVVIAILGILAAVAVPRFSKVSDDAQDKADAATARTILSAVSMAEAKYSGTIDDNKINEFLNDPIYILDTADATTAEKPWAVYNDSGKWKVYKWDGTESKFKEIITAATS